MKIIDNVNEKLVDNLISQVQSGDKLSIAASCFSMYAFQELKSKLQDVENFRFLFTTPSFLSNEKRSEDNDELLCGTEFEARLRNKLNQKAIAREFAEWIRSEKVQFRSIKTNEHIGGFAVVHGGKNRGAVYAPLQGFTTVDLGCTERKDIFNLIHELDSPFAKQYLEIFDTIWRDKKRLTDVKDSVLKKIEDAYAENSPEFVYYVALNSVFKDFLSDISDDDFFANERVGFKKSVIWSKLFDFQKDAALAIINKLERFNGCILADSVGLGKTYTALAVIKYYESRNKSVLVLCPKKLSENWNSFRGNFVNNSLYKDRFRYDVLYHTDLSRTGANAFSNGINLSRLNWGNYDLVVIDESHNFRNGGNSNSEKMNRYQTLMEKVIRSGVKTKVLMLSATPVNNRFNDLRNQLQLAYEDGDSTILEEKLDSRNTIEGIFKKAQHSFNVWSEFEPEYRTTAKLLKMLDYDFFELLDSVTIARSRKHIQMYYDINSIGPFPSRMQPLSLSPELTSLNDVVGYDEIFDDLLDLELSLYTPSHYIVPEKRAYYAEKFGDKLTNRALTQQNREQGLRRLMAINLMKRLESSISSFSLSLDRFYKQVVDTINKIDKFLANNTNDYVENIIEDNFGEDEEFSDDLFVGKKVKISLQDMNVREWRISLSKDEKVIKVLREKIRVIDASSDNKLQELFEVIKNKIENPINPDNHKFLIFTAFADTAEYLYKHVSEYAKKLGLNTAVITGTGDGKSTIGGLKCDFNTLLTCFSPVSKERHVLTDPIAKNAEIDILIGTDCISEGQNLQDCDYCINYDIHWNPVRIIQRYGRIDRIGSTNSRIQLVNFWPDVSLDEYINLKQKIETRMKIVNITATPEEKVLSNEEIIDLKYRKDQLERLKTEVIDIEDVSTSVSITDLGLNDFKLDLLDYTKNQKYLPRIKTGIHAVVPATAECPAGMILVLKNIASRAKIKSQNRLHPYYLVYIGQNGKIIHNHLDSKDVLTALRGLCKGKSTANSIVCDMFNHETQDGKNMSKYYNLLVDSIKSIIEVKKEADINSLFKAGGTSFNNKDSFEGLDDFELICFVVVK